MYYVEDAEGNTQTHSICITITETKLEITVIMPSLTSYNCVFRWA